MYFLDKLTIQSPNLVVIKRFKINFKNKYGDRKNHSHIRQQIQSINVVCTLCACCVNIVCMLHVVELTGPPTSHFSVSLPLLRPPYSLKHNIEMRLINNLTVPWDVQVAQSVKCLLLRSL